MISWPACNHNLNYIENVWGTIKQKILLMHIVNSDQLYVELIDQCLLHSLMSNDHLHYKLINLMHNQIITIIVKTVFQINIYLT